MKSTKFFYLFVALYVIWTLLTLAYSPIVWFDEVFMADYTRNLITTGHLYNTLDPMVNQNCIYGPVFFLLSAIPTSIFGFNIFTVRIVNLLAFFAASFFMGMILREKNVPRKWIYTIMSLFLLDPLNISNSHSGRNDFVAIAFFLSAFWLYSKEKVTIKYVLLISILLALAVLSTPRVVVISIPLACVFLFDLLKNRKYGFAIVYIVVPISMIMAWLVFDYGSIYGFIEHILHKNSADSRGATFSYFLAGGFHPSFYHYLPLACAAVASICCFVKKNIKTGILTLLPIVMFYLFVTDFGGYSMFITPFFYTSIGVLLMYADKVSYRKYLLSVCGLIFLTNIGIFTLKSATLCSTKNTRDEEKMEVWISKNIPAGSKVASSFEYYYALIHNDCDFKRMWREGYSAEFTIKNLTENYHPDYIMVKDFVTQYEKDFVNGMNLQKIASYNPENDNSNLIGTLLKKLGLDNISMTYAGTLYKVQYADSVIQK